jgi:hypothetical protein
VIGNSIKGIRALLGLVLLGCAHGGLRTPDDPVEEARLRLGEILGAQGDVVCAAQSLEAARGMAALRGLGSGDAQAWQPSVPSMSRWRSFQTTQMNLSQASVLLAQSVDNANTARTNARNGVPDAQRMTLYAMYEFDAIHSAITNPGVAGPRGSSSRSHHSLAEAQYATVWTQYFTAGEGADQRGEILDWLTTRSMDNLALLEAYHRDFFRTLRRRCT